MVLANKVVVVVGCDMVTYYANCSRAIGSMNVGATHERSSKPALAMMVLTLVSSKTVACWRRVISSKLGCLHEPVGVSSILRVDGVTGVDGVAGADVDEGRTAPARKTDEAKSKPDEGRAGGLAAASLTGRSIVVGWEVELGCAQLLFTPVSGWRVVRPGPNG